MRIVITGGAGFIGCNAARRYIEAGHDVVVVDDLSRRGSERNLAWLREKGRFSFHRIDIRDAGRVTELFREHRRPDVVLHLAAQVAVTTSVVDPRTDFEVNALGTFNLLEATRAHAPEAAFLFASTNKVYGGLEHVRVEERGGRYAFADAERSEGIGEDEPLDFHSPYGCSKGAADQYVRDYARIYGMRTVTLRQSCVYGERQFGVEDQGWVAWFTIAAALGRPVTLYGDGKQARDVLFVEDLLDLYDACVSKIEVARGQAYNVGGGKENVLSLLELVAGLEAEFGRKLEARFAETRPGDQPVFVCDLAKARRELGWAPKVGAAEGLERLRRWVGENRVLFVD